MMTTRHLRVPPKSFRNSSPTCAPGNATAGGTPVASIRQCEIKQVEQGVDDESVRPPAAENTRYHHHLHPRQPCERNASFTRVWIAYTAIEPKRNPAPRIVKGETGPAPKVANARLFCTCGGHVQNRMIARREAHEEGALPAATEMGLEAGAAGRAKTSTATAPRGGHIAVNPCACACSMCGGNACNVTAGVQGSGMTRRGAAHGSVVVRFCTHLNVDEMEDHHCSGCAAGREDQVHRVELERTHRDPDRSCGGG